MRTVQYEARPLDFNRTLEKFTDQAQAVQWARHRNSNPLQSDVRLIEVITLVQERELAV